MTGTQHSPRRRGFTLLWLSMLLGGLGLGFHLTGLDRPFGVTELAAGNGFGVFAKNYEKFGLVELRGTPLGPHVHRTLAETKASFSAPYFNHPPGMYWLNWLVGAQERHLRLVTAIGHVLSALLLFHILVARVGLLRGWLGGAFVLCMPILAFYAQVGCETTVMPFGLAMLLASERAAAPGRHRRGWLWVLACSAWVGPWMDWQFGFFSLGLIAWCWSGDARSTLRRLRLPWIATVSAVVVILLWRAWAMEAFRGMPVQGVESVAGLVQRVVLQRPPPVQFLWMTAARMAEGFTAPVLLLSAVGLWPLLRRHTRLALTFLILALLNPLIFSDYTTTHIVYQAYAAPLLASACVVCARVRLLGVAAIVALGYSEWTTIEVRRWADTSFYRDVGRVLSEAAVEARAGGDREFFVCTNLPQHYGCYVTSPMALIAPIVDPDRLDSARLEFGDQTGQRYLWLHTEGPATQAFPNYATMPELAALKAYLDGFPSERVPELEGLLHVPPQGWALTVREARLYTLQR